MPVLRNAGASSSRSLTSYTRTCSAAHLPGYVQDADKIKAKKVDEVWCLSVNDAMVMAAWGRDNKAGGKVRMMGDGSAL